MPAFARLATLAALAVLLAGCRMTLTNRIDVNDDGSALVHVVIALDDQLYAYSLTSNGKEPLAQAASTPGWAMTRRIAPNGDHVIEWTKRAGTLDDIKPVLTSFYDAAKKSSAAKTPSGIVPASWTIRADQRPGLFTKTVHLQIGVPSMLPAKNTTPAAALMASMFIFNTELKLPGKIVSTNGEQLADGTIRFTQSLAAPSKIDVVAEVTDYGHIVLAVVIVCGIVVIVAAGMRRRRTRVPAAA